MKMSEKVTWVVGGVEEGDLYFRIYA